VTSVRLLATSALGLASAVDSFWLGRLFERGNAQFYVDHPESCNRQGIDKASTA
jgi:hypothetical protein